MMLKPIKPKRISDQVFDQVRELIFRGTLKPGEKIMPERELATVMNVSRTAIRDAIKKLVAQGLLEQKQGIGTFVCVPGENGTLLERLMDAEQATLTDLLEVRMGLECNAAAMAALKATEADWENMQRSIDQLARHHREGRAAPEADVSFHMALSYATGNPLQVFLMKQIHDVLSSGISAILGELYQTPSHIDLIIRQHSEILEAIKSRNPEKAYAAMRSHIDFVIDFSSR